MSKADIKLYNKFYKKSGDYILVMVAFNEDAGGYTYAARKKLKLEVDDWVVVPTGTTDDVFCLNNSSRWMGLAQVTHMTDDFRNLPKKVKISEVIVKIDEKKFAKARHKHDKYWDDIIPF